MDLNDIRAAVTVSGLLLFVALVFHTWSRKRQPSHEAAQQLPLEGEVLMASARGGRNE